jgi:hypothetical protein
MLAIPKLFTCCPDFVLTTIPQMLFTWDTNNLCIIFRSWHVRGTPSLVISLLAIVALVAGYEAIRSAVLRYEAATTKRIAVEPSKSPHTRFPLMPVSCLHHVSMARRLRLLLLSKTPLLRRRPSSAG